MHTKVLRGLRIRDAPILDQPHSLKLELACKLPSLHDSPPVPSKHLTRCPRNRVQAIVWEFFVTDNLHRLDLILTIGLEPLSAAKRVERVRLMASYESGLSIAAIVIEHLAGHHGLYGHQTRREGDPLI